MHGSIEIKAPPSREELAAIQAKEAEAANQEKLLRRRQMLQEAQERAKQREEK